MLLLITITLQLDLEIKNKNEGVENMGISENIIKLREILEKMIAEMSDEEIKKIKEKYQKDN